MHQHKHTEFHKLSPPSYILLFIKFLNELQFINFLGKEWHLWINLSMK